MATRQRLLARVASLIPAARGSDCTLVGVDGRDGAGKTFFADELAAAAKHGGRVVVRISLDDFHHQRARRYRLGSQSPEGFFMDSYDYEAFAERVLRPLGSGGSRVYWRAATISPRIASWITTRSRLASRTRGPW